MPFDWLITTKKFILTELLTRDGSGFCKDVSELERHTMPGELIEGLGKDGVWFWHDFPRMPDEKGLRADYREHNDLAGKYRYLWTRFMAMVTDESVAVRFVVSNCQANLIEYASSPEDFETNFRIDSKYVRALTRGLDNLGATNYGVTYLVRTLDEYLELSSHPDSYTADIRFAGLLSLPVKDSALASMLADENSNTSIETLAGRYEGGMEIVQSSSTSAILYNDQRTALAVARSGKDSFIFCFGGGWTVSCSQCNRRISSISRVA